MHESHEFLQSFALVLCVAAVTTVLFQRLHQPVVLGYLIAGLIIGPHLPIPLVADPGVVQTLSELGVILLMFSLGLEFSFTRLARVGPAPGITAVIECGLMMWLGYLMGRAFGWTETESAFAGAIVSVSSTTIIAKTFAEQGITGRLRDFVVGILVVEDLIAILVMATLTAVATGRGLSAGDLFETTGKLVAFLVGVVVLGLLLVPRAMRAVVKLDRNETTLVTAMGLCFFVALLANKFGYSVALGAFLAGSLAGDSGARHRLERLVEPVRDMFAAVFFVSVGMLLDPKVIVAHWGAVIAFTALVVVGKVVTVSSAAFLTGNGTRTSVQAGMSLAQIGEFSFIIAGLGVALSATRGDLYSIAITVSALTTLLTPWLVRFSGPAANWVDRREPRALQTFSALYASWLESLRAAPAQVTTRSVVRRLVWLLLADAVLLACIVAAAAAWLGPAAQVAQHTTGLPLPVAQGIVVAGAAIFCVPFALGAVRVARKLGTTLADVVFPAPDPSHSDTAAAPRRALIVTVQLAAVLLVAVPVAAVAQQFAGTWIVAAAVVLLLAALWIVFWRTAADLQGHVRAGAQVIIEAIGAQIRRDPESHSALTLRPVQPLLAGLGEPVPIQLDAQSPAVGRTLADLNLRGVTGATVLALSRGERGESVVPTAEERLREGDVLALAGTHEAVAAAVALLSGDGRADA
jgi:CPA2 family monovalent cation:H+ antiporter-2